MANRKQAPHYDAVIASPLGRLGIEAQSVLTNIDFVSARTPLRAPATALARRVCVQLQAYFKNPAKRFSLPLAPAGTEYQQRVWQAMSKIPSGEAWRYGDLARQLKSAPRAVGGACRANPVPIIVPCHRVVAANGDGGYMGATGGRNLNIKRWLLAHERGG